MKFALVFVAVWLTAGTVLPLAEGWYRLAARYPNRIEEPLHRARVRWGSMGLVSVQNVVTLSACPSGLRVHMMWFFGPFCRDWFVPWDEIVVVRQSQWFASTARMQFGRPEVGNLTIESYLADRLWRVIGASWPEHGTPPEASVGDLRRRLMKRWALGTGFATAVFVGASIALSPNGPPIAIAILVPAFAFGVHAMVQYLRERPMP